MRDSELPPSSVIVGVDGSRNALTAALWAATEAVDRDIPLRLVYAIEAQLHADASGALATAETAVRQVFTAVEATTDDVKIEVEILQGRPTDKLLEASRSAAMACIGAVGFKTATTRRLGSTAAALAQSAHCPVAIIRGETSPANPGSVVVEVDRLPDSDLVLAQAIDEALLRKVPLVVVAAWEPHFTDVRDGGAVADMNRQAKADLSRRLERWTRMHPDLDIRPVAVPGNLLNYLSRHAHTTQLVVVGRRRTHGVAEMIGPPSYAALHDTDCSVLVCDPHDQL